MSRALVLAVFALCSSYALGGITQYNTRTAWTTAVQSNVMIEDFEDETLGALNLPVVFLGTGLGIDVVNGTMVAEVETGHQGYGFPVSGQQWLGLQSVSRDYTAVFQTQSLVNAIAFDITGFQDFDRIGGVNITIWNGNQVVDSAFLTLPGTYGPDFRGIISTSSFDRYGVTFLNGDWVGIDDLSVPVPEPSSLLLCSLLGLSWLTRRKRRS